MFNRSYTIGKAFGIPIKLHSTLLVLLLIFSLLGLAPGQSIIALFFGVIAFLGSVALHELGHSWVAQHKGCYVQEIVLSPIGGVAKITNMPSRPRDEIQIALAGPAVSLALALIAYQLLPSLGGRDLSEICYLLYRLNILLFLFNILPVFPMDGGRVLRAWLTPRHGRLRATKIAVEVAKYFCFLFGLIGLVTPTFGLLIIGVLIYRAGKMEYHMLQLEYQANHWSGHPKGHVEVEVGPPPYAADFKNIFGSLKESFLRMIERLWR